MNLQNSEDLAFLTLAHAKPPNIPAAQEVLYKLLLKHSRAVVFTMLHHADEELSKDIVTKIFASLKNFRAESKFSTWTHAIAINECLTHLRQQKSRAEISIEALSPGDYIKLCTQLSLDKDLILEKAFEQDFLTDDDKLLLEMHLTGGLSWKEIARVLKTTKSAAKSRYQKIKKNLKTLGR